MVSLEHLIKKRIDYFSCKEGKLGLKDLFCIAKSFFLIAFSFAIHQKKTQKKGKETILYKKKLSSAFVVAGGIFIFTTN